eukprot:6492146-Amphidinium_carterae.2
MGVQVQFTTRDLGVDVQWGPWRNPVQQSRVKAFTAAMTRVRMLNLPLHFKMGMIRALCVSRQDALWAKERSSGELRNLNWLLKVASEADPQVTLDLYTIRAWQRALAAGQSWPPTAAQWADATKGRTGRGPVRHLRSLCDRFGWEPTPGGFDTPRGEIRWEEADYFVVTASHCQIMQTVVARRPDFRGIERGLDGPMHA